MRPAPFYPFDHPHELDSTELKDLLGGKGAGLAVMTGLGIPVPPGFTIPTDVCRAYFESGWTPEMTEAVRQGLDGVERAVGRHLGDSDAPLLVSVRSGASVSMPGMMDTVLDVGMDAEVARGLANITDDEAFAEDTLERARQSFAGVVLGEEPDAAGQAAIPGPFEQVIAAVEAVFRSWNSERAVAYRRREGIDPDLGTAATVQAMVFGNLGRRSGTGVAFSRDPSTGEPGLMGDFLIGAQGDDVVSGIRQTIALDEMARMWPEVWSELQSTATRLEHHLGDMVDLEFTVEEGRLWLLQSRSAKRSPVAVFRTAVAMANDDTFPVDRAEAVRRCEPFLAHPPEVADTDGVDDVDAATILATGLAASPGRAVGVLSVDPDDAVERERAGESVVLVRAETSPADVHGIAASVGIVTTLGGLVSHAAVVARSWGLAAVVGAEGMEISDDGVVSEGRIIESGSPVTVDGDGGRLLLGEHPAGSRVPPEVDIIRVWARARPVESTAAPPDTAGEATVDDGLRLIALKGMVSAESVAEALGTGVEHAGRLLEDLESAGLVMSMPGGRVRPAPEALARVDEMFRTERQDRAEAFAGLLDGFHEPNTLLKEIVTAWQIRIVDGVEVPNEHDDPSYDAAVIQRLRSEVDVAIGPVIEQAVAVLPRLARYRDRLDRALARVADGDDRFVAHPLVDSYHTVWFELHEELIRLADRDRRSETEAGRA